MADMLFPPTDAELLAAEINCIERELGFRRRVYPRWIDAGKMTKALADHETTTMQRVLERLRKLSER